MDLVPRVAAALHVFTAAFTNVSAGHDEDPIPTVIDLQTLQRAEKCKWDNKKMCKWDNKHQWQHSTINSDPAESNAIS